VGVRVGVATFIGSETIPSACYILSDESGIPFYSTSNGYNKGQKYYRGKNVFLPVPGTPLLLRSLFQTSSFQPYVLQISGLHLWYYRNSKREIGIQVK